MKCAHNCAVYIVYPNNTVMLYHYNGVIMSAMASQITGVSIVYSTACLGADQRKHQSSASLAFVRGIHRWAGNSPHKGPVTRKMFPVDDVIMVPDGPLSWNIHTRLWCMYSMLSYVCTQLVVHTVYRIKYTHGCVVHTIYTSINMWSPPCCLCNISYDVSTRLCCT